MFVVGLYRTMWLVLSPDKCFTLLWYQVYTNTSNPALIFLLHDWLRFDAMELQTLKGFVDIIHRICLLFISRLLAADMRLLNKAWSAHMLSISSWSRDYFEYYFPDFPTSVHVPLFLIFPGFAVFGFLLALIDQ